MTNRDICFFRKSYSPVHVLWFVSVQNPHNSKYMASPMAALYCHGEVTRRSRGSIEWSRGSPCTISGKFPRHSPPISDKESENTIFSTLVIWPGNWNIYENNWPSHLEYLWKLKSAIILFPLGQRDGFIKAKFKKKKNWILCWYSEESPFSQLDAQVMHSQAEPSQVAHYALKLFEKPLCSITYEEDSISFL